MRLPGLWWAYGLLSLTFLFNLVTIAPFTTALGPNLIVTPADTPFLMFRQQVALLVAAINLGILIALVVDLRATQHAGPARARTGHLTPPAATGAAVASARCR